MLMMGYMSIHIVEQASMNKLLFIWARSVQYFLRYCISKLGSFWPRKKQCHLWAFTAPRRINQSAPKLFGVCRSWASTIITNICHSKPTGKRWHFTLSPSFDSKLRRSGRLVDTVRAIEHIDFDSFITLPRLRAQPQDVITRFYSAINEAQDRCQPLRVVTSRGDKEWLTPEIKAKIKERQRAAMAGDEVRRSALAAELVTDIAARKRVFYSEKYRVDGPRKNAIWQHLDSERTPAISAPIDPDFGRRLTTQFSDEVWRGIDTPDHRRFVTARAFPDSDNMTRARHADFCSTPPRANQLCSFTNVAEQLRRIRNCTPGPDGISGRLLFAAKDSLVLVPVLTSIFNFCLEYSFHPHEWTVANITAIPKVPNPAEPSD